MAPTNLKSSPVAIFGQSTTSETATHFTLCSILNAPKFSEIVDAAAERLKSVNTSGDSLQIALALEGFLQGELHGAETAERRQLIEAARWRVQEFFLQATASQQLLEPELKPNPKAVNWSAPGESTGRELTSDLPFVKRVPLISKDTPIGAAGSCFATEITHYLRSKDYNYVVTEENENSCAAWGGLYNTPSFRQLIEVAFGLRKRPSLLFECEDTGKKEFWDPFREGVFFETVEQFEESTRKHLAAAKEALMKTKVFIMTVGLNEVWRLTYDDSVLARYPRTLASHLVHKQILTVEENVNELQRMLDVWRTHNPELKIIITVSPVPLYATFRAEESHVIAATCHSKSVLRIAVDQFVRQNPGNVFYMPAFEVVSYCAPEPWTEDCRHVTRETVGRVMGLFEKTFLTGE